LSNVEAAEDFYVEALEELDRKPYPTVEGTRNVIKFVAEQNPKVASLKAERIVDQAGSKNSTTRFLRKDVQKQITNFLLFSRGVLPKIRMPFFRGRPIWNFEFSEGAGIVHEVTRLRFRPARRYV
jgi:hypothetical protein